MRFHNVNIFRRSPAPSKMTTTMTAKECGHHEHARRRMLRRLLAAVLALAVLVLLTILIVWLVLRPTKPQLVLQDATVYAFNISAGSSFLSSVFQVTLSARNPNGRVGIYYDKVDVYASYRGQQITLPTLLPPTYQGHKDVTVWSPFLFGDSVPVAPYYSDALTQDRVAGTVLISIRVYGKIRWKVGAFISGRYHMTGNCPAYINLGRQNAGNVVVGPGPGLGQGPGMKFRLVQRCNVDV